MAKHEHIPEHTKFKIPKLEQIEIAAELGQLEFRNFQEGFVESIVPPNCMLLRWLPRDTQKGQPQERPTNPNRCSQGCDPRATTLGRPLSIPKTRYESMERQVSADGVASTIIVREIDCQSDGTGRTIDNFNTRFGTCC